jgi:hypothetical protein
MIEQARAVETRRRSAGRLATLPTGAPAIGGGLGGVSEPEGQVVVGGAVVVVVGGGGAVVVGARVVGTGAVAVTVVGVDGKAACPTSTRASTREAASVAR